MKGETQGLKVRKQVPMSWNPGRIRYSQPSEGPFEHSFAKSLVESDCTQPSNTTGFCVPTAGPDTQEDLAVLMVRAGENLECSGFVGFSFTPNHTYKVHITATHSFFWLSLATGVQVGVSPRPALVKPLAQQGTG